MARRTGATRGGNGGVQDAPPLGASASGEEKEQHEEHQQEQEQNEPLLERGEQPSDALIDVRLATTVGLRWPDDGRTHYYGPGPASLPSAEVQRLEAFPHRMLERVIDRVSVRAAEG
jgi:hypothetical protein